MAPESALSGAVFLTGLSASGKTTLAKKLIGRLRERGCPCLLLDSTDMFRHHIMPPFDGFTLENRRQRAEQLVHVVNWVAEQGVLPVASVIGQPPEIRTGWYAGIQGFTEIYLKCDVETCRQRDNKNLYGPASRGEKTAVVGIDIPFVEPETVSLTLDSAALNPEQLINATWHHLEGIPWFREYLDRYSR